jgi:hypothetical protein
LVCPSHPVLPEHRKFLVFSESDIFSEAGKAGELGRRAKVAVETYEIALSEKIDCFYFFSLLASHTTKESSQSSNNECNNP